MRLSSIVVLLVPLLLSGVQSTRPKGVRVEMATFYNPSMDFKCLDGSNTIPFIQINDDYCDCDDGSDEPGTSACPNGKFYCENVGHKSLVIPSSRVGDGICDCCDGSDEWETGSSCANTCYEMGRAAREAAEAMAKVAREGIAIRSGMVEEAKRLQEEKVTELTAKEARKVELDALKTLRENEKEVAEAPEKEALDYYRKLEEEEQRKKDEAEKAVKEAEAAEYFTMLDLDGDGQVGLTELQARPGLDTNKDGEVSEEEAKFFLSENESFDLETFISTGYVLLKPYLDLESAPQETGGHQEVEHETESDEGLTPPVDDGSHMVDHPMATPAPHDPDAPDHPMMTPEPPHYKDDEDYHEDEEETEDYDVNDDDDDDDEHAPPKPAESIKEAPKYDEVTQQLISQAEIARKAFNDAEREFLDVEREIKGLKDILEKDYGTESEYLVLQGQCFEYTDNEYKYKMCPFDHCSQRGKSGGGETRLGSWGEWVGPEGEGRYSQMKFTGGQGCWNGPARSTLIHLHCGTENWLSQVSEPNRCEYEMHFTTPAACTRHLGHDEL